MKRLAILFIFTTLYGGELNQTIIDANISFYRSFLQKLSSQESNNETELQRAILEKIIALSSSRQKPLTIPKTLSTQKDYKKLINDYLEILLDLQTLNQRIEQNKKLIQSIQQKSTTLTESNLTLSLQYALYKKIDQSLEKKIAQLQKERKRVEALLKTSLGSVHFYQDKISQDIQALQKRLQKIRQQKDSLELDKERYEILGKKELIARVQAKIKALTDKERALLQSLLVNKILLFFSQLQSKKKSLFITQKKITDIAQELDIPIISYLQSLEKDYLGTAFTIQGWTAVNIQLALKEFWQKINEPLFSIGKTSISSLKIALALFVIVTGFILGGIYKKALRQLKTPISQSTKTLFSNLGYYLLVIVALFFALNILGIDLSSLTLIAGALSVGIGFGLQNIVSNFVSGIILMFERSVKIGDYIELNDNLRGYVSDIRMRSTTITTNSNIDIVIPNQEFIQNRVINWTMKDKIRRFEIPFGVAYGSDIDKVKNIIVKAVQKSGFPDIYEGTSTKSYTSGNGWYGRE